MTDGGFIHSGYVQPVETTPNPEVIEHIEPPGVLGRGVPAVCHRSVESRNGANLAQAVL